MARTALALGGGIVGGLIGGPIGASAGFTLGNLLGGIFFGDDPAQGPTITGPRLNDTTVTTSTYGKGIPITFGAVRVGGNIREPTKLKNVNPTYPDIARQARVQGIVILECTISPQGRVTDVKVLRGIPLLDQSAIDAVKQWVYTPTLLNGVPVPVIMTVTVNFKFS